MTTNPTLLSDTELAAYVGARVAEPRIEPADSFVLHAPLELTARCGLLPFVREKHRDRARARIVGVADQLEAAGPPVPTPSPGAYESVDAGAQALLAAIDHGDLDAVDRTATWLGDHATVSELRSLLTGPVLPRLAAAGHAPIFLFLLPRVAPRGELPGRLLRGLARELGRYPDWRIGWVDTTPRTPAADADALFAALAATPSRDQDGPTPFIFPLMSHVDADGTAPRLLAPVTGASDPQHALAVGRGALRTAAWSMVLEPGAHAPYGWSHCLTMPLAALGIAGATPDPGLALAVAATYVVGFRAALAGRELEPAAPTRVDLPRAEAWRAGPATAGAVAWHTPDADVPALIADLAGRAAVHHDAHLVKYTLACFDASALDPEHRRLYLAAAATLSAWWAQLDGPEVGYEELIEAG
jgi:hypothetical protein